MLLRPCSADITDTFADHVKRDSPEPGVDYAASHGTEILAAGPGKVDDIKRTNTQAMGRYVRIALDDGRTVRYLHLSDVLVELDDRVEQGTVVARSGASGKGKEDGYDPHVHTSLWKGKAWQSDLIDFEREVGPGFAFASAKRRTEDDDMLALKITSGGKEFICALGPGIFRHFISRDPFEKIKNLMRVEDDWQFITLNELPPLLRTYGCDLQIWNIVNGDFAVLDPLTGTVQAGNMWSSAAAVRADIKNLIAPVIDNAPALEEDRRFREEFERNSPGLEPVDPAIIERDHF